MKSQKQNKISDNENGRREFLRKGLITTSLVAMAPAGLIAQTDDCDPTTSDIEGPFYSANPPFRQMLASPEETGDRLFLSGVVYAHDCITPLNNVIVDLWQADHDGCYSRFGQNCTNVSEDEYKLRGQMRTGSDGTFAVETIRPGRYLNGADFRPSHIHLKAIPNEGPILTTQIYFEGDPYIANDPWASHPSAAGRIISLREEASGFHGLFDIVLDIDPPDSSYSDPTGAQGHTRLRPNHPNPVADSTLIPFNLAQRSNVRLTIHNVKGQLLCTLVNESMEAGAHAITWDGSDKRLHRLPAGTYIYRLRTGNVDMARKLTLL